MKVFCRCFIGWTSWLALAHLGLFVSLFAAEARGEEQQEQLPYASGAAAKALNPDISLIGLFSLSQFNRDQPLTFDGGHDPHQSGFNIQQVELTYGANVDPYFRGDANLVLTPEGIEIEEAYATTLDFPLNLQLKGGQFFTAFGRQNPIHPHAWDFADKPLVLGRFFGGDGLRNPGVQLSWLTPLPWYSEILGSGQNSNGETATSFRPDGTMRSLADVIGLLRWSNFFSVSEPMSLNVGASYLNGVNASTVDSRTRIYGGDIYLKYRNPESLSFVALQVEVLWRDYVTGEGTPSDRGWYAQLTYRLPEGMERWHLGVRYDWLSAKNGVPVITSEGTDEAGNTIDLDTAERWRLSPVITFFPSEFSKIRLQYEYDKPQDFENAQQVVSIQLEFLMGAHGAHKF